MGTRDRMAQVAAVAPDGILHTSGAGDTFIAGLVRGYIQTKGNIENAIKFAQRCTTHVVQKHGVATVSLKELQNG